VPTGIPPRPAGVPKAVSDPGPPEASLYGVLVSVFGPFDDNKVLQVLADKKTYDDIFRRVMDDYAQNNFNVLTIGPESLDTKNDLSHALDVAGGAAQEKFLDALKKTATGQRILRDIDKASDEFNKMVTPILGAIDSSTTAKVLVIVGCVGVAGFTIAKMFHQISTAQSDPAAGALTTAASLIPKLKKTFAAGSISISLGKTEWKPSTGMWNATTVLASEWKVSKQLSLGVKADVMVGRDAKRDTPLTVAGGVAVTGTYRIGTASVVGTATANWLAPGTYDVAARVGVGADIGQGHRVEVSLGLAEREASGIHAREATAGVKLTF
jgi:hypothetical protein